MSLTLCLRPALYRQGEQSLRRLGRSTFDPFSAARRDNPSFRQLNIATLSARKQDVMCMLSCWYRATLRQRTTVNPSECKDKHNAASNNMKLVHWPLMGGLLHLVQRGGDWAGQPAQSPPRCTKCNNPPINGQCTNHRIPYNGPLLCGFNVPIKECKSTCNRPYSYNNDWYCYFYYSNNSSVGSFTYLLILFIYLSIS